MNPIDYPPSSVVCRADLGEAEWQAYLGSAADTSALVECPFCRGLWFRPFRDPGGRGMNVRCLPGERDLHRHDCGVVHGGLLFEPQHWGNTLYAPGIVSAEGPSSSHSPSPGTVRDADRRGYWYGTFVHLVNAAFVEASLTAFAEANRELSHLAGTIRNPDRELVFEHLAAILFRRKMTDGSCPDQAAKAVGLRFYWGILESRLVDALLRLRETPGHIDFGFDAGWDCQGPLLQSRLPEFSITAAPYEFGKVMAHREIISPPYLVFLTATPAGQVARIAVIPVCLDSETILSSESDPETRCAQQLARLGAAVVKLGVHGDLRLLGNLWPFPTTAKGHLPCRPDFIVYYRGKIRIYQLAGSTDAAYVAAVDESVRLLGEVTGHTDIARKITLEELNSADPAFLRELKALPR